MTNTNGNPSLLDAILDSWDRNNTMLVNLLRALPAGGFEARAMEGSPSVAQTLSHIHFVRLFFISEDAPEFAPEVPTQPWAEERDVDGLARKLNASAKAVREVVAGRLSSGKAMNVRYDHPILFLQHMMVHEGYHHGQIKLALKITGRPMSDEDAGRVTWSVLTKKRLTPDPVA
jgi:uncharacterized damage-inducible protein DinB